MKRTLLVAVLVAIFGFSSLAFAEGSSDKININTANAKKLDKELKYVGETIAKRIVEYRKAHGNFTSLDDLTNVRGIGKKVVEGNKKVITLK